MYDFANSGYTTVVITAVFAAYFVGAVANKAEWATLAWTSALSVSYAIVMLTMPAMGEWADRHAAKKKLLMAMTAACVVSTAALAWVEPGQVLLALILIVISNTFYTYGESLTAAFLPELAKPEAMGRISAWGWAWGYLGGMLTLGVCLAYVLWAQGQGQTAGQFVPITMLMTAAIYALAAGVTFALMKEHAKPQLTRQSQVGGWQQLVQTFKEARAYKDFMQLLACAVAYQGGVAVAITLAAIYAEQVIGFEPQETMMLIFVLNIAALLGSLVLGYAQDRIGHKLALSLTLWGWGLTCGLAALSSSKEMFWWAAVLAGVCMGSSQSTGRAMAGLFIPSNRLAEFFGLWAFAIRLASILGPMGYGLVTWATEGNQRLAIAATSILFLLGWLLLLPINVQRGQRLAVQDLSPAAKKP
ncbi:MFS transporter [Limnohabitans sp. Rim11]|uniref:MFS transporter n=1 Tax=Limnohabitans sp. Rim11 TaxID=1100719 RepID=UPI000B7E8008|nr:MFS transporter [Limnohabitans sp. Rim11]